MCKENLGCLLTERCTNELNIRADARKKFAEWLEENVFIDVEGGATVVEEVEYTRVISFMELLAMYEKEQK